MRNGRYGRNPRLTKEQEAIRLKGLRILARIIVRAHLASLIESDAGGNGTVRPAVSKAETPGREDERGG